MLFPHLSRPFVPFFSFRALRGYGSVIIPAFITRVFRARIFRFPFPASCFGVRLVNKQKTPAGVKGSDTFHHAVTGASSRTSIYQAVRPLRCTLVSTVSAPWVSVCCVLHRRCVVVLCRVVFPAKTSKSDAHLPPSCDLATTNETPLLKPKNAKTKMQRPHFPYPNHIPNRIKFAKS